MEENDSGLNEIICTLTERVVWFGAGFLSCCAMVMAALNGWL